MDERTKEYWRQVEERRKPTAKPNYAKRVLRFNNFVSDLLTWMDIEHRRTDESLKESNND